MKKLSLPIISTIALVCAVISVILRILSLSFFYDELGYYQSGAPLPIISNILFGLSIAFVAVAAILFIDKSDKKIKPCPPSGIAKALAFAPVIALAYHALQLFIGVYNDSVVNKYVLLAAILISIVFFVMLSFLKKKSSAIIYVGLGALIYIALLWANTHFDFIVALNSTNKIFFHLSCVAALLFIFNEICAAYGKVKSKFYYFSLLSAIITLSTAAIPSIIGYLTGSIKEYLTLEGDLFFVALLAYAIARLITLLLNKHKDASESQAEATETNETTEMSETNDDINSENPTDNSTDAELDGKENDSQEKPSDAGE